MVDIMGQLNLRTENVERAIKGLTSQMYVLQTMVGTQVTDAWKDTYFTEDNTVLTGGTGNGIEGIPRGAEFPELFPNWTKQSAVQVKFGGKGTIFEEDALSDYINVRNRTFEKVAQAIVSAVDGRIYTDLSGASGIGTAAAVATWDDPIETNRKPIEDIAAAIQWAKESNLAIGKGYLCLSPKDEKNFRLNPRVIANPSILSEMGLSMKVTNSVAADEAMIYFDGGATWKTAKRLATNVDVEAGIKTVIKAWEYGQLQVHQPKKIYVITNTQA